MNYIDELLKSLYVMASMVEARDPYTGGHLWRVSQFSRILATDSKLPDTDVARIALGGFLHDLGKVGVPDAILNKADRLSDEEYAVIKTHPEVGSRLLSEHPLAELARAAVLYHHEMPNGNGYPHRLSGLDIPLDARLVGICDAFDAMTSNRPYRRGMPVAKALSIIEENLGAQFDHELGSRFLNLGHAGALAPIVGFTEPGIPVQECPICGPTIVVRRRNQTGDHVYCRHCGNEAVVEWQGDTVHASATGRKGTVEDLEPDVDIDLIDALIRETARHIRRNAKPRKHDFFGWFQWGGAGA
ncbi:MAG: HD-GYP domain-containing protein [Sulfuricella sp.]